MSKILAVDTSTQACSAALLINGEINERYTVQPQQHTKLILPMIDELMAEAGLKPQQLDAIAFASGPGSFTGLRIAAGVVQGIAFALDLPVVAISTLRTLAQTAYRLKGWTKVLTALDARMNEIYWGSLKLSTEAVMEIVQPEQLCHPQQIPLPQETGWYGVGDGWVVYGDMLKQQLNQQLLEVSTEILPHAQDVAHLAAIAFKQGKVLPAVDALPDYLRDNMYTAKNATSE